MQNDAGPQNALILESAVSRCDYGQMIAATGGFICWTLYVVELAMLASRAQLLCGSCARGDPYACTKFSINYFVL